MFAVNGFYDGVDIKPMEAIPFDEEYEVVITFIKPSGRLEENDAQGDVAKRLAVIDSLIGVLPSTVTDDEVREARLERYERGY